MFVSSFLTALVLRGQYRGGRGTHSTCGSAGGTLGSRGPASPANHAHTHAPPPEQYAGVEVARYGQVELFAPQNVTGERALGRWLAAGMPGS